MEVLRSGTITLVFGLLLQPYSRKSRKIEARDGGGVSLERRRVVEETLAPGAAVARVAPENSSNHYQYDTLNRLGTPTNSLTGQFSFGYDALSRRTQLTRLLRPFIRS